MSRSYMKLSERPEDAPIPEKGPFEDRIKTYKGHLSRRHESHLRIVSFICVLIFIASVAFLVLSILILTDALNTDWSFIGLFDIGKWLNDNYTVVFVVIAILSVVMMVSSMTAAVTGFKQEYYLKGLAAYAVLIMSSFWTVVIPIITIILMICYVRAKGSFFS